MFLCFSLWLSLSLMENHVVRGPEENQHDPVPSPVESRPSLNEHYHF